MKWQQQQLHLSIKNNDDYARLAALLRAYGGLKGGQGGPGGSPLTCCATSHRCHHAAQAYTQPPPATYVRPSNVMSHDTRRVKSAGYISRHPTMSLFYPTDNVTANIHKKKHKKDFLEPKKGGSGGELLDSNKKYYVRFSVNNKKEVPAHPAQHNLEVEEKTF